MPHGSQQLNPTSQKSHILCTTLAVVLTANAAADAPKIGDIAPEWKQLTGTDGEQHSSSDLQDAEAVVVCFTCNTCPYSVDYENRLIALQKKYADAKANVRIVAINSNAVPVDNLDSMKKRATEQKFNFVYLKDESQDVARAFDAIYTPEFYVLNRDRKIVYRGAMDDHTDPAKAKVNFIELAVDATLHNRLPDVSAVGARGCAIRFKRKRR